MRGMRAPNPWEEPNEPPHPPPWSAAQARAWRAQRRAMAGPWHALGWQLGAVLLVTLLGAAAFGANVARSVAYGGAAALVPSAVMALAMRGALMRAAQGHATMSLMTLLAFEMLKVALAVALLFAAPVWLGSVVWPALLVGLVVGLKAHLMVMAFGPSGPRNPGPSQYPDK